MDNQDRSPAAPSPDGPADASSRASQGGWRPPAHRIRFCQLESCQPDGGRELAEALEERLGVRVDERPTDGSISLEALDCIGLCDIHQAVTVDDEPVIGRKAVLEAVDELLDR